MMPTIFETSKYHMGLSGLGPAIHVCPYVMEREARGMGSVQQLPSGLLVHLKKNKTKNKTPQKTVWLRIIFIVSDMLFYLFIWPLCVAYGILVSR